MTIPTAITKKELIDTIHNDLQVGGTPISKACTAMLLATHVGSWLPGEAVMAIRAEPKSGRGEVRRRRLALRQVSHCDSPAGHLYVFDVLDTGSQRRSMVAAGASRPASSAWWASFTS